MAVRKVGVARRGAVPSMPEELAHERQVLARHDRLAGGGMAQVMEAQPAEPRVGADRAPGFRQYPYAPAFGMAREQERVRLARAGQRGYVLSRGFAERDRAATSSGPMRSSGILPNAGRMRALR